MSRGAGRLGSLLFQLIEQNDHVAFEYVLKRYVRLFCFLFFGSGKCFFVRVGNRRNSISDCPTSAAATTHTATQAGS